MPSEFTRIEIRPFHREGAEEKYMKMNKKGAVNMGDAPALVLSLGLMVLIGAAVALAVQSFGNTLTTDTAAYNVSKFGLQGLQQFSAQIPTIGVILGVALIIGIVLAAFAGVLGSKGGI